MSATGDVGRLAREAFASAVEEVALAWRLGSHCEAGMKHPEDVARYRASYAARQPICSHDSDETAHRPGVVYTITTIAEDDDIGRTVAVVDDFALADAWLRSNSADLFETIYLFAVVEQAHMNELYGGYGRQQYWYAWDPDEQGFRPVEAPEFSRNTCGYGIG